MKFGTDMIPYPTTIKQSECAKCKGKGWVWKDILNAITQPCECRQIGDIIQADKIQSVTLDGSAIVAKKLIVDGTIAADQIIHNVVVGDKLPSGGPIWPPPPPSPPLHPDPTGAVEENVFSDMFKKKMSDAQAAKKHPFEEYLCDWEDILRVCED